MLLPLLTLSLLSAAPLTAAQSAATQSAVPGVLPYQNAQLTPEARAADLLGRLSLAEKIGQMTQAERGAIKDPQDIARYFLGSLLSGGGSGPADNTPAGWADMIDGFQQQALSTRLKIPLLYGADAVHGHNNVPGATLYPHNIGLGATRDAALVQSIGRATAEEVAATGVNWTFSPCLCVARDVRWGRTYESFGERPELATLLSSEISGYQGTAGTPASILATAKHFVGDGGTTFDTSTNPDYLLDQGDTRLSETDLRRLHLPPFQAAVKQGVASVMVSFSSVNGLKMHGDKHLITDVLKGELGFQGFVISDWAGIDQISPDYALSVRSAINAGLDMVMVPNDYPRFIDTLTAEVTAGRVPVTRIDDAVRRILIQKFRFGVFEHPLTDRTLAATFGSAEHKALARKAVQESLVLLKNQGVLPISKSTPRLLVTGSNAADLGNQLGGWSVTWQGKSGNNVGTTGTTILAGIRAAVSAQTKVDYLDSRSNDITPAQVKGYDVGIVVVGETPYAEGQGDRSSLTLSPRDQAAVNAVCSAVRCVVVTVSGRPLILTDQLPRMGALVAAWLPGSEGEGVADALFGNTKFTGKLSFSWPRSMAQVPVGKPRDMGAPLFAYGFGLEK
ncbi:glycoside hydrolase family 3 protein [Deinococcus alpinitundrae]|uniref:glycoside hydrolase family 3 protein n=1 Tax=Deinococcus alpinitundrae TaxID=468913 RepID=UPI00192A5E59|nr:glycoside hydrolase family 3 protein [Deinococcus alpinitundrae]